MIRCCILLLLYMFSVSAFCEQKQLAVLELENLNVTEQFLSSVNHQLRTQILQQLDSDSIRVIPHQELLQVVSDTDQTTSCFNSGCVVEMAQLLAADYVLSGVISKSQSEYTLKIRLHEAGELKPLSSMKSTLSDDKSTLQEIVLLALKVLKKSGIEELSIEDAMINKSSGRFSAPAENWSMDKSEYIVVQFNSEPTGSVVELNGKELCKATPCQRELSAGQHKVVMKKPRYQSWSKTFTATDGLKVFGKLNPHFGYLQVISEVSGVHLSLDGKSLGMTPLPVVEVNVGTHKIAVNDPCYTGPSYTFDSLKNQTEQVEYPVTERQAGIRVSLVDVVDNVLSGKVYVDNVYLGETPGTFQVGLCSKELVVKYEGRDLRHDLALVEKKITVVDLKSEYQATLQTDGYEVVLIPSGRFTMGCSAAAAQACSDAEKPVHQVTLSRSFYMMKSEVTQQLYKKVVGTNPSRFRSLTRPVEKVSWYDAVRFANALSELEGREQCYQFTEAVNPKIIWSNKNCRGWRLPTEAEWEYAARGGAGYKYAGGNNVDQVAWYDGNSVGGTHEVCRKKRNKYGLCDMSGNVFEWVWDSWRENYGASLPVTDPIYVNPVAPYRVLRGGDWENGAANALVSFRDGDYPSVRLINQGFRLVRGL